MNDVKELAQAAGLAAPRSDVDNLAFFQVRGDCLAPDVLDGDVLFAAWRPAPAAQAGLRLGDLAVFLLQDPGRDRVYAVLKRWQGLMAGPDGGWVSLCGNADALPLPASRVHLLATRVRLAFRGQGCSPNLLAGTVYAGLDLWFREDVARILASTHETMAASMRASAPLDPKTAGAYQQGFVDALRAVAVAFGVASPGSLPIRSELLSPGRRDEVFTTGARSPSGWE